MPIDKYICPDCGYPVKIEGKTTHYFYCEICKQPIDAVKKEEN